MQQAECLKGPPTTRRLFWVIFGIYVVLSLYRLQDVPPLWYDEIVHLNSAAHLATDGRLWCDFYNSRFDGHLFISMPLQWLLLAAEMKCFGVALLPARLLSVVLSLVTLGGLYTLTRRLLGDTVALFAAAALAVSSVFFDTSRQVLPQVPSATFSILAILVFSRAAARHSRLLFAAAGVMGGLAALSHPTGIAASLAVGGLFLFNVRRLRPSFLLIYAAAAALTVLPYVAYILSDFANYQRWIAVQVGLYSHQPLVFNVLDEIPVRYLGLPHVRDPHYWDAVTWMATHVELKGYIARVAGPAVLVVSLAYLTFKRRKSHHEKELLLITAAQFAFLAAHPSKFTPYLYVISPYLAACLAVFVSDHITRWRTRATSAVAVAVCAIYVLSNTALVARELASRNVKPYAPFIAETTARVPKGSRIAAPVYFWLGMHREYRYTSANEVVYEADAMLQARAGAPRFQDLPSGEQDALIRTILDGHQIEYVLMTNYDWEALVEAPRSGAGFGQALKRYLFTHAEKTTDLLRVNYYAGTPEATVFAEERYSTPEGATFANVGEEYQKSLKIYRLK